jgi:hypothetical protein
VRVARAAAHGRERHVQLPALRQAVAGPDVDPRCQQEIDDRDDISGGTADGLRVHPARLVNQVAHWRTGDLRLDEPRVKAQQLGQRDPVR